jgi:hypothetical protein
MDTCNVKFGTMLCLALAGLTVTTIGILLNAMFSIGIVA